jgi:hypothetical protein
MVFTTRGTEPRWMKRRSGGLCGVLVPERIYVPLIVSCRRRSNKENARHFRSLGSGNKLIGVTRSFWSRDKRRGPPDRLLSWQENLQSFHSFSASATACDQCLHLLTHSLTLVLAVHLTGTTPDAFRLDSKSSRNLTSFTERPP